LSAVIGLPVTPGKVERFTKRSKSVLSLAQQEAEANNAAEINTAHLLIAMIRADGSVAQAALLNLNLTEVQIVGAASDLNVLHSPYATRKRHPNETLQLAADIKQALEMAVDEARRMSLSYIGTEHLLLALMGYKDCRAYKIVHNLSVEPQIVIDEVRRILKEAPPNREVPTQVDMGISVSRKPKDFSQRARQILLQAQQEAEAAQVAEMNTEHLLIAMIRAEGSITRTALLNLKLTEVQIVDVASSLNVLHSPFMIRKRDPRKDLQLAAEGAQVFKLAMDEARRMDADNVDPEHLLLAVMRYKECRAYKIIQRLDISPFAVIDEVRRILKEASSQSPQNL
jgi:ATP-dependent Clp protease ATP-binding subunit ClpA